MKAENPWNQPSVIAAETLELKTGTARWDAELAEANRRARLARAQRAVIEAEFAYRRASANSMDVLRHIVKKPSLYSAGVQAEQEARAVLEEAKARAHRLELENARLSVEEAGRAHSLYMAHSDAQRATFAAYQEIAEASRKRRLG